MGRFNLGHSGRFKFGGAIIATAVFVVLFQNCSKNFDLNESGAGVAQAAKTFSLGAAGGIAQMTADTPEMDLGPFVLPAGQMIAFGDFVLFMQTDGNLVIYQGGSPMWATSFSHSRDGAPTYGRDCATCHADFQSDGNLVLYGPGGAYWDSETWRFPGAHLHLSTSAPYLSILSGDRPVWTSLMVMPLGDSNTYGYGDAATIGVNGGYRGPLADFLSSMDVHVNFVGDQGSPFSPDGRMNSAQNNFHAGYPSWSIQDLLVGRDGHFPMDWVGLFHPQFILLMAGTNDLFNGTDVETTKVRTNNLINEIFRRSPHTKIVLSTIFPIVAPTGNPGSPWQENPALQAQVQALNAWFRAASADRLAHGQPVYLADNSPVIDISHMADAYHPQQSEYRKVGAVFGAALLSLLIDQNGGGRLTSYALNPTTRNVISAMYEGIFNKPADPGGYGYWLGLGQSRIAGLQDGSVLSRDQAKQLAIWMTDSQGAWFAQTYAGLNNPDFIQTIYQNIAGSPGDAGGAAYWASRLDGGESRTSVMSDLIYAMMTIDLPSLRSGMSDADYQGSVIRQRNAYAKILSSAAASR